MSIVFTRVEERLLHGQVITAWAKSINFDTFVVVYDESASNDILKSLLEMACPKGKKLYVFDEKTAVDKINAIKGKIFLIVKSPTTILSLLNNGLIIDSVNIGSIHYKPDKKEIYKTVYLSEEEVNALKEITDRGITCEIQKLPTESKKNILSLL